MLAAMLDKSYLRKISEYWKDRSSNIPIVKDPAMQQIMANCIQIDRVMQEQARLDREAKAHEKRTRRLEKILDTDTGYMSITAYCKFNQLKLPLAKANKLGRKVAKYCRDEGIMVGSVPDERFGTVNTYPADIIEEFLP